MTAFLAGSSPDSTPLLFHTYAPEPEREDNENGKELKGRVKVIKVVVEQNKIAQAENIVKQNSPDRGGT